MNAPLRRESPRGVELNADVGELAGEEGRAADRELISLVTAANVACGAHAGDDATIEATLRFCAERGVVGGAHPSYPDREGFGRRRGAFSPEGIRTSVAEQLRRFLRHAERVGAVSRRVKAHGALYNESAFDRAVADTLLSGIGDVFPGGTIVALAGSPFESWAEAAGFRVVREGFADRGYRSNGTLVPRGEPGALLADHEEAAAQAVALATGEAIRAADGKPLRLLVDTLCLHGDSPGAARRARAVREALERAGVPIVSW